MMSLIADPLLLTSKRNSTTYMGLDGNVLWAPTLVVSSLILKGLSSILLWRPSISSSLKEPPLLLLLKTNYKYNPSLYCTPSLCLPVPFFFFLPVFLELSWWLKCRKKTHMEGRKERKEINDPKKS